jgi:hypothetical protein
MKTNSKILLLFVFNFIFSSCGKLFVDPDKDDSGGSSSGSNVSGTMTATLDGKSWKAKTVSFGGLFATVTMAGKIDDENIISLEFNDTKVQTGKSYKFDMDNLEENLTANLVVQTGGKILFAKSGTFNFKKYKKNSVIEGELNAVLTNFIDSDITLKDCKFSMEYK